MTCERVPVLVLPGLGAGDASTMVIRAALAAQGHRVHRWNLGTNRPSPELSASLRRRFFDLVDRYDEPLALVGWSLGGLYAHRIAEFAPNHVRSVITLGSPLRQGTRPPSLAMPTTSIYSKNDRIVPWQRSLIDDQVSQHQNIEVRSTHLTLGFDPAVLFVIGDRVRRSADRWRSFHVPLLLEPFYPGRMCPP